MAYIFRKCTNNVQGKLNVLKEPHNEYKGYKFGQNENLISSKLIWETNKRFTYSLFLQGGMVTLWRKKDNLNCFLKFENMAVT